MKYTYEHRIQYYETDQMGIVHHSNYIRWFEEARTDALEQAGFGYHKMEESSVIIPVVAVAAEYKTMSRFGETVVIETEITRYKGFRFDVSYTVYDKDSGEIRTTGSSQHCFLSENKIVSLKRSYPEIDQIFLKMME